jgi:DNA-binding XRE family transcriptional regulator
LQDLVHHIIQLRNAMMETQEQLAKRVEIGIRLQRAVDEGLLR